MIFFETTSRYSRFLEEYCGGWMRRWIMEIRGAFVAGGALVSMLDAAPPRDIDVYVPSISPSQFRDTLRIAVGRESEMYSFVPPPGGSEEYTGSKDYLYLRYNDTAGGRSTVMQLIFWPLCDPLNVISGYDIEICKIGIYGNVSMQGNRFANDYSDRVINLAYITNMRRTYERIQRYVARGYSPSKNTQDFMKDIERRDGGEVAADSPPEAVTSKVRENWSWTVTGRTSR